MTLIDLPNYRLRFVCYVLCHMANRRACCELRCVDSKNWTFRVETCLRLFCQSNKILPFIGTQRHLFVWIHHIDVRQNSQINKRKKKISAKNWWITFFIYSKFEWPLSQRTRWCTLFLPSPQNNFGEPMRPSRITIDCPQTRGKKPLPPCLLRLDTSVKYTLAPRYGFDSD